MFARTSNKMKRNIKKYYFLQLVSPVLCMCVCVNFIHGWRGIYSLKSISNDRFFALRFFARNLLQGSRRRNIFSFFVLLEMFDLGALNNGLAPIILSLKKSIVALQMAGYSLETRTKLYYFYYFLQLVSPVLCKCVCVNFIHGWRGIYSL